MPEMPVPANSLTGEDKEQLMVFVMAELKRFGIKVPKIEKLKQRPKSYAQSKCVGAVFGTSLPLVPCTNHPEYGYVPKFLNDAREALRNHMKLEGLFRKTGSISRQKELKHSVEDGRPIGVDVLAYDLTCVVKQFFREMPDPLFTSSLVDAFVACSRCSLSERPSVALLLCLLLPPENLATVAFTMSMLAEVARHCQDNRMDSSNLAVCLAPNFFGSEQTNEESDHGCLVRQQAVVVETLIENAKQIGVVPSLIMEKIHVANSCLGDCGSTATSKESLSDARSGGEPAGAERKKRRSSSFSGILGSIRRSVERLRTRSRRSTSVPDKLDSVALGDGSYCSFDFAPPSNALEGSMFDIADVSSHAAPIISIKRKADCDPATSSMLFSASKRKAFLLQTQILSTPHSRPRDLGAADADLASLQSASSSSALTTKQEETTTTQEETTSKHPSNWFGSPFAGKRKRSRSVPSHGKSKPTSPGGSGLLHRLSVRHKGSKKHLPDPDALVGRRLANTLDSESSTVPGCDRVTRAVSPQRIESCIQPNAAAGLPAPLTSSQDVACTGAQLLRCPSAAVTTKTYHDCQRGEHHTPRVGHQRSPSSDGGALSLVRGRPNTPANGLPVVRGRSPSPAISSRAEVRRGRSPSPTTTRHGRLEKCDIGCPDISDWVQVNDGSPELRQRPAAGSGVQLLSLSKAIEAGVGRVVVSPPPPSLFERARSFRRAASGSVSTKHGTEIIAICTVEDASAAVNCKDKAHETSPGDCGEVCRRVESSEQSLAGLRGCDSAQSTFSMDTSKSQALLVKDLRVTYSGDSAMDVTVTPEGGQNVPLPAELTVQTCAHRDSLLGCRQPGEAALALEPGSTSPARVGLPASCSTLPSSGQASICHLGSGDAVTSALSSDSTKYVVPHVQPCPAVSNVQVRGADAGVGQAVRGSLLDLKCASRVQECLGQYSTLARPCNARTAAGRDQRSTDQHSGDADATDRRASPLRFANSLLRRAPVRIPTVFAKNEASVERYRELARAALERRHDDIVTLRNPTAAAPCMGPSNARIPISTDLVRSVSMLQQPQLPLSGGAVAVCPTRHPDRMPLKDNNMATSNNLTRAVLPTGPRIKQAIMPLDNFDGILKVTPQLAQKRLKRLAGLPATAVVHSVSPKRYGSNITSAFSIRGSPQRPMLQTALVAVEDEDDNSAC